MPARERKKPAGKTRPSSAKKPAAKRAAKPSAATGAAARTRPGVKKAARRKATRPAAGRAAKPAAKPAAGKPRKAARPAATPRATARKATRPAAGQRAGKAARLEVEARPGGPDPEGFFVARVRGEDAARDAPHQLLEPGGWDEEEAPAPPRHDEGLGELPWTYGEDLLVALPRDPHTLFVYWDQARASLDAALAGVPGPKVQLWVFARGQGWDRVRAIDVALEARGWYVHDLEPGRAYRVELHVVGSDGQDRLLPGPSLGAALPPVGPSPVIDDRYATLPWDVPLPRLVGPGFPGGPFSDEARALLARLSGWTHFGHSQRGPTSPPGGPSSPGKPYGGEGR